MKKRLSLLALSALLSNGASAEDSQTLEQRVQALETALAEAQASSNGSSLTMPSGVDLSGSLEVEANHVDQEDTDKTSDVRVDKAILQADATLSDNASAKIGLLYEEDESDLYVDIATITYGFGDSGVAVELGRNYLPFGSYSTVMINDLLTYSLGSAQETSIVTSYRSGDFSGSIYVFNGDQDEGGRDTLTNFGGRIAYSGEYFTLGADYISNLADSDDLESLNYGFSAGEDAATGTSIYGSIYFGGATLYAEQMSASGELAVDGNNSEPSALHVELSYEINNMTLAVAHQEMDETLFLGTPEERTSLGAVLNHSDNLTFKAEYSMDDDYSVADGGSGLSTDSFTLEAIASF